MKQNRDLEAKNEARKLKKDPKKGREHLLQQNKEKGKAIAANYAEMKKKAFILEEGPNVETIEHNDETEQTRHLNENQNNMNMGNTLNSDMLVVSEIDTTSPHRLILGSGNQ